MITVYNTLAQQLLSLLLDVSLRNRSLILSLGIRTSPNGETSAGVEISYATSIAATEVRELLEAGGWGVLTLDEETIRVLLPRTDKPHRITIQEGAMTSTLEVGAVLGGVITRAGDS